MNSRVKALWLPGVCTSALSTFLLRWLQFPKAPPPHILWVWHDVPLVVYWHWLACLPLIGAVGAYWSRRAGGTLLERVLAASLHMLGLTSFMGLIFCFRLAFNARDSFGVSLAAFVVFVLGWGITPCLLLLLGTLPFLRPPEIAAPLH